MIHVLKSLRDFMTPEALKFLPGILEARTCILLEESLSDKTVENGVTTTSNFRTVIHVFDKGGTFIGTIERPHHVPSFK